jgi:hypothetical protein
MCIGIYHDAPGCTPSDRHARLYETTIDGDIADDTTNGTDTIRFQAKHMTLILMR